MARSTKLEIVISDLPEVQQEFEEQVVRYSRLKDAATAAYVAWAAHSRDTADAMLKLQEALRS